MSNPGLAAWRIIKAEPELWEGLLAIGAEEIVLARGQSRSALQQFQFNEAVKWELKANAIEEFLDAVQAAATSYSPPKTSA